MAMCLEFGLFFGCESFLFVLSELGLRRLRRSFEIHWTLPTVCKVCIWRPSCSELHWFDMVARNAKIATPEVQDPRLS